MTQDFNAAMRRAMEQTRAGDPFAATRTIQASLGDGAAPSPSAPRAKPVIRPGHARTPSGPRRSFTTPHGSRDCVVVMPETPATGIVLMLHGCTQTPEDFAIGTGMNAHAARHGLIVVYPHQARDHNMQGCWNWFRPGDQGTQGGEPALLAAIVRQVQSEHALPADRCFAAGLSAGGAMAAILGITHPDLFAAVGVHSGLPRGAARDLPSALSAMAQGPQGAMPRPDRRARLVVVHGDADSTVHPANADRLVSDAAAAIDGRWHRRSGTTGQGRSFTWHHLTDSTGTSQVAALRVAGAGHAWQGGAAAGSYTDPAGPDASDFMVRFFLNPVPGADRQDQSSA